MSGATVTMTGRVTARPELRSTSNGLPVANFTVAHTPRRQTSEGDWEDAGETVFLRVTAWRDLAENAASSLNKGDLVTVTGTLGVRNFTNDLGKTRQDVTCNAESVAVELRGRQTVAVMRADRAPDAVPDSWAPSTPAVAL